MGIVVALPQPTELALIFNNYTANIY